MQIYLNFYFLKNTDNKGLNMKLKKMILQELNKIKLKQIFGGIKWKWKGLQDEVAKQMLSVVQSKWDKGAKLKNSNQIFDDLFYKPSLSLFKGKNYDSVMRNTYAISGDELSYNIFKTAMNSKQKDMVESLLGGDSKHFKIAFKIYINIYAPYTKGELLLPDIPPEKGELFLGKIRCMFYLYTDNLASKNTLFEVSDKQIILDKSNMSKSLNVLIKKASKDFNSYSDKMLINRLVMNFRVTRDKNNRFHMVKQQDWDNWKYKHLIR